MKNEDRMENMCIFYINIYKNIYSCQKYKLTNIAEFSILVLYIVVGLYVAYAI